MSGTVRYLVGEDARVKDDTLAAATPEAQPARGARDRRSRQGISPGPLTSTSASSVGESKFASRESQVRLRNPVIPGMIELIPDLRP